MIRYALRCAAGHKFESWFASGEEFDRLSGARLLSCAVCGEAGVEKELMAPGVRPAGGGAAKGTGEPSLRAPADAALAKLRSRIEAVSEDVGRNFATEARRIHDGEAPARPIIGEARPAEARALIADGVPIAPLPWGRARRMN